MAERLAVRVDVVVRVLVVPLARIPMLCLSMLKRSASKFFVYMSAVLSRVFTFSRVMLQGDAAS
jgi:hypothetical protein